MAETVYDFGDIARLAVTFKVPDAAGTLTDPTDVTATVRQPDGTTASYTLSTGIIHDSTGAYHLDVPLDLAGSWTYKFVGTGTAADVGAGTFYVRPDITADSINYISRDEVKIAASLSDLDYADVDIDRACTAVSRALDEVCRGGDSHFYQATETRYYTPDEFNYTYRYGYYGHEHRLEIDDLAAVTSLTVDTGGDGSYATTWVEGTDFFLDPANADTSGKPFEEIVLRARGGKFFPPFQRAIKVTGTFGWPSVPVQLNQYAVIYVTQMVIRTRQAPLGILTASLESGGGVRISRLDPDFDRLLGQFVRTRLIL